MGIIGTLLMVIGGIIALVGGIMFLIVAFKESILWGIGCFIIPFVGLIFLVMHWGKASKPFFIYLGGFILAMIGGGLSGSFSSF